MPARLRVSLLLLAAAVCGCGPANTPNNTPNTTPAPAVPAPAAPSPVEDRSLTAAEYIKLGLPADDREWSGEDMTKAAKVLTDLAAKDAGQLPRFNSPKSGTVFARITADNHGMSRSRTLPLQVRMQNGLSYMKALNDVNMLYLSAFLRKQVGGTEGMRLLAEVARAADVMGELADEFLPTIPKDDPDYAVRMGGFAKMKRGAAGVVQGSLTTLTEAHAYSRADRVWFAESLTETMPPLARRLEPGSRAEMLVKLDDMNADPKLSDLQPALGKLRDAVKKAVADAK